ncbi:MAG: HAMP domain-containing histidine kinase [Lachnospiraceae bacterium]|nr:HAMP domain-containing histidine kinase [Lachnospiraceae bacterium]
MTAFLSAFIVVLVLVGGINISNYVHVIRDSDKVLKILEDNGGVFPDMMLHSQPGEFPEEPPRMMHGERIDSPEIAFETRFFTVEYSGSGEVVGVNTDKISAVSEETATGLADKVISSGRKTGFIYDYRYVISDKEDGGRLVIFCDRGAALSGFRNFRNASIVISLIGLMIIGCVIYFISGKAVRPIEEAGEKQKRFISDAGHEIKTPLSIIRADADVLGMELGEDNEWISDIVKQTERLALLTNDLITLSKMEEGQTVLDMEEVDISALAEDVADSVKAPCITRKITFLSDIEGGVRINCDKKKIYELMSILLDNAVKYCPEGGEVSWSLSSKGKKAVIRVTNDLAQGMDKETVRHLFDRFYRADSSRNSESGGFGIGLSVARAVTEAHKGRITADLSGNNKIVFTAIL